MEAADALARLSASSRQFLGLVVHPLGYVRADARVPLAVRSRRPFLTAYPNSVASRKRAAAGPDPDRGEAAQGAPARLLSPRWPRAGP